MADRTLKSDLKQTCDSLNSLHGPWMCADCLFSFTGNPPRFCHSVLLIWVTGIENALETILDTALHSIVTDSKTTWHIWPLQKTFVFFPEAHVSCQKYEFMLAFLTFVVTGTTTTSSIVVCTESYIYIHSKVCIQCTVTWRNLMHRFVSLPVMYAYLGVLSVYLLDFMLDFWIVLGFFSLSLFPYLDIYSSIFTAQIHCCNLTV